MGRQIRLNIQTTLSDRSAVSDKGDAYLERLLKLIPSETVALFLFIEGILLSALNEPNELGQLKVWLWTIFVVLLVGNILYLIKYHDVTDPIQYVILTLAYCVWVFTIGGPFKFLSFYQPFMGAVILGLFTFFVPIFYMGKQVE